jgi:hypothetical protein
MPIIVHYQDPIEGEQRIEMPDLLFGLRILIRIQAQ